MQVGHPILELTCIPFATANPNQPHTRLKLQCLLFQIWFILFYLKQLSLKLQTTMKTSIRDLYTLRRNVQKPELHSAPSQIKSRNLRILLVFCS
jgi:hypothetical protein